MLYEVITGHQAEHNLHETVNNHPFLLVVEGAIPTKDNGIHCMIAGKTAMEILAEVAPVITSYSIHYTKLYDAGVVSLLGSN